ncbi:MAG TPA: BON domain-containing protein [Thermoanaerobaculia bacterium]|nr:BON domain-containing protein [Thermoanaerobaculia bacterium]
MNLKANAMLTVLLLMPLAACDRDGHKAVQAERDSEGKARIHIDGDEVESELKQAGEQLERGADQVQRGAEQVGAALERGAERIEAEVGPVLDDASITARIKTKLIADPEINSFHIDVDTVDGRVALNGKVASAEQREEAEDLARGTTGVRQVVNLIQVAGQAPPASPAPSGG